MRLRSVSKVYPGPPELRALHAVDLEIASSEFVTVRGRSGSGKSTLLNILGLLDRPSEGTYELAGEDVSGLSERERTWLRGTSIGFVFQSFQLLPDLPALDNVMLALLYRGTSARRARTLAAEALERVGLADRGGQLPSRMSGGEKQRVAIARAVVGEPSLLLCDEPTGNLDTANSESVMGLFSQLNDDGTTIVLITHDVEIAGRGTRRVSLLDGRLSELDIAGETAGAGGQR